MDAERSFDDHVAGGPTNIIVATAICNDGDFIGIFSTYAGAQKWADSWEDDEECKGIVFAPYVIDVPEYGNVPKAEQQ